MISPQRDVFSPASNGRPFQRPTRALLQQVSRPARTLSLRMGLGIFPCEVSEIVIEDQSSIQTLRGVVHLTSANLNSYLLDKVFIFPFLTPVLSSSSFTSLLYPIHSLSDCEPSNP